MCLQCRGSSFWLSVCMLPLCSVLYATLAELGMSNTSFVELTVNWCGQANGSAHAHTVSDSFLQLPCLPA